MLLPVSLLYQNGRCVFGSVILVHVEDIAAFDCAPVVDSSAPADFDMAAEVVVVLVVASGLSHCDLPSLFE